MKVIRFGALAASVVLAAGAAVAAQPMADDHMSTDAMSSGAMAAPSGHKAMKPKKMHASKPMKHAAKPMAKPMAAEPMAPMHDAMSPQH